ncbi:LysM peptidoglycan-binding domain-containing protein [Candidatus Endoriftia persephone]|jgi:hypothetical protein|uniref:LysM domain protein n=3 Tax=Gammaproteobacteria TaxID=1236 RepID=G2FE44_9GAMM|nr:LysM domain-containing protein [Candidatus Endoriftia persephone]EGV50725.1 LysM domain protein [endosymbiont of Riftia pachyptila (vent Ph05)]EGW55028.1 LysM domain protein [endosymbiont of Tevnia jerichonana (vent Tica)]USF87821.1 LysM peptidoglycan-binding domain-containing protein [Candidatus Endoriftia persephone]
MSYFSHKPVGILLGLLFSFVALAAEPIALDEDHPSRYTVLEGDTLWDIADRFLRDPWRWPDIWYVNPEISNPHLIYPGDVILLTYQDGRPVLTLERDRPGRGKLSPHIRATPLDTSIPLIPIDAIAQFLTRPYVMEKDQMESAPYIVHFLDDHIIGGAGVSFYARTIEQQDPGKYEVIRPGKPYKDPASGKILGYEASYIGPAELLRSGDPAKLQLQRSKMEAIIGDRLLPVTKGVPLHSFQPLNFEAPLEGRIISVLNGVSQIGQYNVVVLNKGASDGLKPGHVLEILQGGDEIRDVVAGRGETVKLPLEKAGLLMVFRTFEQVSFALVMHTTKPLHILDWVRPPEE